MQREKTIIGWGIDKELYVIINSHDIAKISNEPIEYGEVYYKSLKDIKESERIIYNAWRQIIIDFNNGYDYHLFFKN